MTATHPSSRVVVKLTLEGAPIAWARAGRGGGRSFTPKRVAEHQDDWRRVAQAFYRRPPVDHDVILNLAFWMPTRRRPDVDNLVKCVMDAMNGVLYVDDAQVVELHAARRYDPTGPGATHLTLIRACQ